MNILYVAPVDWFWIKQRPQHFAEILSEDNLVTYLNVKSLKKNKHLLINKSKNYNENLKIERINVLPRENKYLISKSLNNYVLKNKISKLNQEYNYDVIILTYPRQIDFIPNELVNKVKLIYDCMDDYEFLGDIDKQYLLKCEKKIMDNAQVIVSSENLKNILNSRYRYHNKKIKVINNGVDIKTFNYSKYKDTKRELPKKVAYIGTISSWMDFETIKYAAERLKEVCFYFVGPIELGLNLEWNSMYKNIIFTGPKLYEELPKFLSEIDVAIMPFIKNELVSSVNPVKVYEYLAMGKDVIATDYEEIKVFGELIQTYKTKEEFLYILQNLLNKEDDYIKKVNFAQENSWEKRVMELVNFINEVNNE